MNKILRAVAIAICWAGMIFMFSSCSSTSKVYPAAQPVSRVILAPGDQLEIKFGYSQEFNEIQTVRPDGKIAMQFVGEVIAAGKTPVELRDELMQLFSQHLKYPQLAVFVRTSMDNRVYVGGEVTKPGLLDMPGRLTVLEAIMMAGGFKMDSAGTSNVVVIRQYEGKYHGQTLDLKQMLAGNSSESFYLAPRDIIFVPQSRIVKIDQWIDQNINKIIPDIGFNIQRASPSGRTNWGYSTNN